MKVKSNIFGSISERNNYRKLLKQWSDKYRVYHNIPFLMVFELEASEIENKAIYEYLKKTSIDYVICNNVDKALVGIEFDGLQQGISIGNEYVPKKGFAISRQWGLETKLKIAHQCEFPLLVASDKEFSTIPEIGVSIVDGLIGAELAKVAFSENFNESNFNRFLDERHGLTKSDFELLSHDDKQHMVESFGIDTEVDAWFDNNPILRRRWKIQNLVFTASLYQDGLVTRSHLRWGHGALVIVDPTKFVSRMGWYELPEYGRIEKRLVLPRFNTSAYQLGEEIVMLLAITELARKMQIDIDNVT